MRILLVDDEKKFVTMLAKRLVLRGIEADVAFSGDEALEKLGPDSYDLAILDVKMPNIGGIDLRRKLSKVDPNLKYIFLTGHGSRKDFDVGSSEADFYLAKPIKIETLLSTIELVMGRSYNS